MKNITVGAKVFAKVRGYTPWPGRVVEIADAGTAHARYSILFYGTNDRAWVRSGSIYCFFQFYSKFGGPRKIKKFMKAMKDIKADLNQAEQAIIASKIGFSFKKPVGQGSSSSSTSQYKPEPPESEDEEDEEDDDPTFHHDRCTSDESEEEEMEVLPRYLTRRNPYVRPKRAPVTATTAVVPIKSLIPPDPDDATISELAKINHQLRVALSIQRPDLHRAVELLDRLLDIVLSPYILKKVPGIIATVRKVKQYGGMPPKNEREAHELAIFIPQIHLLSVEVYRRFEDIFQGPPNESSFVLEDEFHGRAG